MTIRTWEPGAESTLRSRGVSSGIRFLGVRSLALLFALGMSAVAPSLASADGTVASLKRDLRKAIGSNQRAAMDAINELASLDTEDAVEVICDYGFRIDNPELERFSILRLRELPKDGEGVHRLAELCNKHKDYRVRLALVFALETRKETVAYTAVVQNVYDRVESVQLAALEAIRRIDGLAPVETLIEALALQEEKGRSSDRVAWEIRKTLTSLTNLDFEYAADWKNFWSRNKDGFQRPSSVKERKTSVTSVRRQPPLFFGMEVNTKRFLFLLDVSGSMSKKDPLPEEGEPEKVGPKTSVGKKKKKEPSQDEIPDSRRRLSRVQKELIAVISRLPHDVQFNIVTFNHEIKDWKKDLVFATDRNKRAAIDFVQGFRSEGETHTDQAFERAFEHSNINTIFLLSDGAPRRDNQLLDTGPILEWIRNENRFRRIAINSVTFEQCGASLRKFMESLARQNSGGYKELR